MWSIIGVTWGIIGVKWGAPPSPSPCPQKLKICTEIISYGKFDTETPLGQVTNFHPFRATWGSNVGQKNQKLPILLKKSQNNRKLSQRYGYFCMKNMDVPYLLHTTIFQFFWCTLGLKPGSKRARSYPSR